EELRADNRHNLLDILDDLNSRNCVKLGEGGGGQELGDQFNSPPKWLLSGTRNDNLNADFFTASQ
ncbi:MAG: hypothetical protein NTX71_10855, partial [Candidatus Aureabacteria bacterium]|nr:hypothetical protein [Candidatus Auribacterota bacterium]